MKKRYILLILFFIFLLPALAGISFTGRVTDSGTYSLFEDKEQQKEFIITKSPEEMLPSRSEIPTEFTMGAIEDMRFFKIPNGLEAAKTISLNKIVGRYIIGMIVADLSVAKFSTSDDAEAYYQKVVDKVKKEGGYSKVNVHVSPITKCFSFSQDYGFTASFATSYCHKANVYFEVQITATQTYEKPSKYLQSMVSIIDKKAY